MSLDTCTVPGSPKEARIPHGKAELGLGIHGEAGIEQVDYTDARTAIAMVCDRLGPLMAPGVPHVAHPQQPRRLLGAGDVGARERARPLLDRAAASATSSARRR